MPTPIINIFDGTRSSSVAIDGELEEVRCARDAWIVVADRLLALQGQLLVIEIDGLFDILPQIALDDLLILRRRRHNFGVQDCPGLVESVAMIQDAARRLGAGVANSSAWSNLNRWPIRRFVFSMTRSASSQAYSVSTLRTTMLWKGLWQVGPRPASRAASCASGREPLIVEVVARQRADEIGPLAVEHRVQRIRVGDVLLSEALSHTPCTSMSRPRLEAILPSLKGYSIGMAQGDELIILLEGRKR